MIDVIWDTVIDIIKILPFLYLAFLLIELVEHKFSKKSQVIIERSGRFGPILGSLLGCIPQCGFSVMATNLYVTRIITLGTLISIYLSTSDEMLPIMIAGGYPVLSIVKILLIKFLIASFCGIIIDLVRKQDNKINIHDLCQDEHCHCEEGIIKSSIIHTIRTTIFLLIVSFIINLAMYYGGEDILKNILVKTPFVAPLVTGLIGLIPNCAASAVITELYLSGVLPFSSAIAGLLTGSGVAMLVLFKTNHKRKENFLILGLTYLIGVSVGLLFALLELFI